MKPAEPAMLFLTSGEASQEPEPEDAIPEMPEPAERVMLFFHPHGPAERGARYHPRCGLSCNQESRRSVPAEPGDAIFFLPHCHADRELLFQP